MEEHYVSYEVGFYIEAPFNTPDNEILDMYLDLFEKWVCHGGKPALDYVKISKDPEEPPKADQNNINQFFQIHF